MHPYEEGDRVAIVLDGLSTKVCLTVGSGRTGKIAGKQGHYLYW